MLVWLTWKLAAALAEVAQLPSYVQRSFMTSAALLAAIPPLYDAVIELRTYGGYIETFVLMLWLLLSSLQLTRRWQVGAPFKELAWRWAGIGLIVGLGFWIDPLIVSAVIAAAIWIVCNCAIQLMKAKQQRMEEPQRTVSSILMGLLPAIAAVPTFLLGVTPAIFWGARNHWANVKFVLFLVGLERTSSKTSHLNPAITALYPNRLAMVRGLVHLYTQCVVPAVISVP